MPLIPEDVHNVVFRKPSMGRRGYDGDEVDAFLDEVEQEMLRLRRDNQALRAQLQPSGGAASQQVITRLGARLQRLQEERDQARADAERIRAELERALATPPPAPVPVPVESSTQDPSICVIAVARRTADECLRTAERQARQLLTTARTKADQLTSEAELNAATIDSDARHRYTEEITSLDRRRADALVDIEQLWRFAAEYEQALRDHVRHRLDELAGPKA